MGLTACGGSADPTGFSASAAEPSPGKVEITAPATVKSGLVKLTFKNTGQQPHDAAFVRVDAGHSSQELVDNLANTEAPIPAWAHVGGGVSGVKPGETSTAEISLAPGSYYLVDPGSDDNNKSFAKAGAIRPLEVTGTAANKKVSGGSVTITAHEYSFDVPVNLKAGKVSVKFQNSGRQPHHLVAVPLMPGKTLGDAKTALSSKDQTGPPPVDFSKAIQAQVIDGGGSEVTTLTFEKGNYIFVCFLTDRGGGPEHFNLGMLQAVSVS